MSEAAWQLPEPDSSAEHQSVHEWARSYRLRLEERAAEDLNGVMDLEDASDPMLEAWIEERLSLYSTGQLESDRLV